MDASKKTTRSTQAGLQFPVGRVERLLRQGGFSKRCSSTAPVYLAAVLEYVAAEILELAGLQCVQEKRQRITPRHIHLGLRNDEELNDLLRNTVIAGGGVVPHIHSVLVAKQK